MDKITNYADFEEASEFIPELDAYLTEQEIEASIQTKEIDGESYYVITSLEELQWFGDLVSGYRIATSESVPDANAVLENDIVMNENLLENVIEDDGSPMYTYGTEYEVDILIRSFNGTFDGQGHTISGYCNIFYSLFSSTGKEAVIKNLNMTDSLGPQNSALLIGTLGSGARVENCHVSGYSQRYGGLVQEVSSGAEIVNCSFTGTVYGQSGGSGIAGTNNGTISGCSAEADIVISGYSAKQIGGIAGVNNGTVENCRAVVNFTDKHARSTVVGGVVGQNSGTIKNSYSVCGFEGLAENAYSGIVNSNTGTVENCYYMSTAVNCGIGTDADAAGKAEKKTAAEFRDGTVAKLLGEPFVQRAGIDEYPILPFEETAVVVAELERDSYSAGDTVTANVYLVSGSKANTMGYGLSYNPEVMVYQSAQAGEKLSIVNSEIDKNTGSVVREFYVTPGTALTEDENGRVLIDTLTFVMTADGNVGMNFVPVEDATDVPNEGAYAISDGEELETGVKVVYLATAAEDMAAAAKADELIEAIGEPVYEYGAEIDAAREAYEALTEEQKGYVKKLEKLETSEKTYNLWGLGDVNLNGVINANDLSLLLSAYGTERANCDLDGSGAVDAADLSVLLANYRTKLA